MMSRFLSDPFTPLGKWLSQPFYIHGIVVIAALSAVIFRPVWDYWETHLQWQQQENELNEKQSELAHQEKILHTLEQQSAQRQLSPELGAKIMPVNKQIQRLAERYGLQQTLRWEMAAQPILHLQLNGHFNKTRAFLTALLSDSPLSVGRLQFVKPEDEPLQTEIIFQLNKENQ